MEMTDEAGALLPARGPGWQPRGWGGAGEGGCGAVFAHREGQAALVPPPTPSTQGLDEHVPAEGFTSKRGASRDPGRRPDGGTDSRSHAANGGFNLT